MIGYEDIQRIASLCNFYISKCSNERITNDSINSIIHLFRSQINDKIDELECAVNLNDLTNAILLIKEIIIQKKENERCVLMKRWKRKVFVKKEKMIQKFLKQMSIFDLKIGQTENILHSDIEIEKLMKYVTENKITRKEIIDISEMKQLCYICNAESFHSKDTLISHYYSIHYDNYIDETTRADDEHISKNYEYYHYYFNHYKPKSHS